MSDLTNFADTGEVYWTKATRTQYQADGLRMAKELSRELGHDFEVRLSNDDASTAAASVSVFRVRHEARNPDAAAAAYNLVEEQRR